MTHIIPLTKIGFFNPGRLSDEEIEQSFIARVPFFEFIFKKIAAEKANSIPQHHLIIGQRGMGKSSLLVRIAAELRKQPYNESFIPLSFPEEQYNVDRLSKFWLNCMDALADALDKENKNADLVSLDNEISNLSKIKNLTAKDAYDTFAKWISKIKRRPVLLVDNLNLIFSKIDKEEQHQLRAILITKGAPILVGASATAIDETIDYQAPFYDAFQINYLKKLSFEESLNVLLNLAQITGNNDFKNNVYLQKGRLEALYQLTGGTPRTLAILFPLIQNGFSEDIQTDLDALLDIITPLYKARFEELPEQLQVVMDAIALHWDPINLEQLREATMLENGQLSPQLKRLIDIGWLQKLDAYKAKGSAYELTERFFNVWYLMRRSSRRQKRELYCLTKFLESFYGTGLSEIAKARIAVKSENLNHIALDLALADAVKEKELSEKLRNKSYEILFDMSLNNQEVLKSFTIPTDVTSKKTDALHLEFKTLYQNRRYVDAETALLRLLKVDEHAQYAWYNLGLLNNGYLHKYNEAEAAYKKAIELDDKDALPWNRLGKLYQDYLGRYTEAEDAYKKAIELDDKYASPWNGLGNLYQNLGRYTEAEDAYKKAIELDDKYALPWNNLGVLYQNYLGRYTEAEDAYKKAIELDDKDALPWNNLGNLYQNYLGRYTEAEDAYKKAIELDNKDAFPWNRLGKLYQDYLGRYTEAEDAYKKAIELDNKDAFPWNGLGNLYQDYLGRYTEAEDAYKKAIELNDKGAFPWNNLGNLYKIYLGRYTEAEDAYKKAIELDDKYTSPWNGLGNLYQDYLNTSDAAEAAYKKALEINPNGEEATYNLLFLWRDKMNKLDAAKQLFYSINKSEKLKDSYALNEALFAYYEKNTGLAVGFIKDALLSIGDSLPKNTSDDWYRSASVIIKLGFGDSLLSTFSETGYDIILKPLYVAIEAVIKSDEELFLNSIAAEIREPAKKIAMIMKKYME